MSASAILGVCKIQLNPLDCDGVIDINEDPLVYCGATEVTITPILTDGLVLNDPSGIPNKFCVKVNIDPDIDYYDMALSTCSLFDPRFDALVGYTDTMVDLNGDVRGSKARKLNAEENCICECGDEACQSWVGVTVWSLNLCPDGTFSPDGQFNMTVTPATQFRANTDPIVINNQLNGRNYIGRTYENPQFGQGPGDIIPVEEAPYDRAFYRYPSDVCPPGGCDCGGCGNAAVAPTPLSRASATSRLAAAAASKKADTEAKATADK